MSENQNIINDANQYYYHHTKIEFLKEIVQNGLVGKIGYNSRFGKETLPRVYFSEGIEGVLAISEVFQTRFNNLKNENHWENITLEDFLGKSVYLRFSSQGYPNENPNLENAFRNGCTSKNIPPEEIKICYLKDKVTGQIFYHRDDIIKYLLAIYLDQFQNGDEYQKEEIKEYYKFRKSELDNINWDNYVLKDMDLTLFYNQFLTSYLNNEDSINHRR